MVLSAVTQAVINPAMLILPQAMDSPKARVMLLAIGGQESEFVRTIQEGDGPAHGFWQFEIGGVRAVMSHALAGPHVKLVCEKRKVLWSSPVIWSTLATDQILACCMARLLLYADPRALPDQTDSLGAWNYYLQNWRPGKPRPADWPENHRAALSAWSGHDADE